MRSHAAPRRTPRLCAAFLLGLWLLTACAPAPPAADDAPQLRFSAIPDQKPERVREQHVALMTRVCELARLRCTWVDAPSYDGLVSALGRGEVDVAYFGAATFARAHQLHAAQPLAMRDIDTRFTSVIVVRQDAAMRSLVDLKGRPFAFGNRSSTSGHLMLRERLRQQGVEPERDFASVTHFDNHDATMAAVADGRVAAGGVNTSIYFERSIAGDPNATALRVVWRSAPYVDYVWGATASLPPKLRSRLVNAFLDLRPSDPASRDALTHAYAGGYVPAYPDDFTEIGTVLAPREGAR